MPGTTKFILSALLAWSALLSTSLVEAKPVSSSSSRRNALSTSTDSSPCEGELDQICGIRQGPNSYQEVYDARMCLWANRDLLSGICRTYILEVSPSIIEPCYDQILLYCKDTQPGENRVHNCLLSKDKESNDKDSSILPKECHAALEYDLKMNEIASNDAADAAAASVADSSSSSLYAAAAEVLFSSSSSNAEESLSHSDDGNNRAAALSVAATSQRLNQRMITDLMEVMLFRNVLTAIPASGEAAPVSPSVSAYLESLITSLVKELTLLEHWMSSILPISASSSPSLRGSKNAREGDDYEEDDDTEDDDIITQGSNDDDVLVTPTTRRFGNTVDGALQQNLVDDDDQALSRFTNIASSPIESSSEEEEKKVLKDLEDAIQQVETAWSKHPSKDDDGVDKKEKDKDESKAGADFFELLAEVKDNADDDDGVVEKVLDSAIQQLRESDNGLSSYPYYAATDGRDSMIEEQTEGENEHVERHGIVDIEVVEGEDADGVEGHQDKLYFEEDYLPNSEDGSENEEEVEIEEEEVEEEFEPRVDASEIDPSLSPAATLYNQATEFSDSVWTMIATSLQQFMRVELPNAHSSSFSTVFHRQTPTQEEVESSPSLRGFVPHSEEQLE